MSEPMNDLFEDIDEEEFLDSIGETDFVFILDADGNLKTLLMPESVQDDDSVPENVLKVLKALGMESKERTLH